MPHINSSVNKIRICILETLGDKGWEIRELNPNSLGLVHSIQHIEVLLRKHLVAHTLVLCF